MQITVRLFAMLRERAGADGHARAAEGAVVADALAQPERAGGELPLVMAVNREYAPEGTPLAAGDELALVPPVSGGRPV